MAQTEGSIKGRVTVYSVIGCPHCLQAKSTLKELGLPVCDVDINPHAALRDEVKKLTGRSTVPQIFFNNVHVGGNDDLQKMAPEELQRLVQMVREQPIPADAPPLPVGNSSDATEESGEFMCERDAFADLVEEFKSSGVIGSHRKGLRVCKNSFTGTELVDWLQTEKGMASELSEILRNLILKLYADHLSSDGKFVDYKAMSQSPFFEQYCELAVQLQRVELGSLSREEKLAFFINVYNALVIHGNLRMGIPKNMWQRYRFFNYASYLIGGEVFTLQDIENGVLRGNRKGVAQILKPFSKSDPRLQVALPDPEPLIHFALNCGAKGCPPIKTYTPQGIDSQLRSAAEAFLENDDGCLVDPVKGEVKLSQIFKWYKVDFGGTDEKLLNWILKHMSDSPKKVNLQNLLSSGSIKVSFMPYDWSTNSKD
ncbi:uncharacterized protein zgc:152951 isoform X2 [Alosa alosa]|uniref:uncharacterized protein zgc:152951 isoform X2 n=1 Tax=Alosa sapidissima TaxID=34773 RepID=UPI001C0A137D|nr:uncharacterized protein zgc:152951 isoform X2 [Alosa sapidissima]XP_048095070.1 uncharacterized protein zgc:152951 isoform X2 [Alosa alosa]